MTPRCAIPDWFPALFDDARSELAAAEQHHATRAAERKRLQDAAAAADSALQDVATATAPDGDAVAHAEHRAETARDDFADAQHQLAIAPRRHRRADRRDLEIAEQRVERADAYLELTRQRTEPAVEQYQRAEIQRRDVHANLNHRDIADLLDAMQHPLDLHRQRVVALEMRRRDRARNAGAQVG